MAGVERPPIRADIGAKPARLGKPLRGVVTTFAKAHERAEPEFVDISMMWLDVIADCRWLNDAALKTELAQRMFEQLVPPNPGPTSRRIPLVPLRRSAANTHNTQSFIGRAWWPPIDAASLSDCTPSLPRITTFGTDANVRKQLSDLGQGILPRDDQAPDAPIR